MLSISNIFTVQYNRNVANIRNIRNLRSRSLTGSFWHGKSGIPDLGIGEGNSPQRHEGRCAICFWPSSVADAHSSQPFNLETSNSVSDWTGEKCFGSLLKIEQIIKYTRSLNGHSKSFTHLQVTSVSLKKCKSVGGEFCCNSKVSISSSNVSSFCEIKTSE